MKRVSLFGYAFEPLDHAEHDCHRNKANHEEYGPAFPKVPSIVHERANPQEEVADGSGAEPQTLTKTLQVLRCHFRHERESER